MGNAHLTLLFLLAASAISLAQSCSISSEYHLVAPGTSLTMNVSYSNFLLPSPLAVVCRSGVVQLCIADSGSGSCVFSCDYPYAGVYTVSGSSFFSQCSPSIVVVDQSVKPNCSVSPKKQRANGTLSSHFTAVFSNLLPNETSANADCGNDEKQLQIPLIGKTAQLGCQFEVKDRKKVFFPSFSAGGTKCSAEVAVIPSSDSIPPEVSFYNLTNRMAIRETANISINASDNSEIDRVELYINKSLASVMSSPPYYYVFNVSRYANNTMFPAQAFAYDIYGNSNSTPIYYIYKAVGGERACNLTANPIYGYIPAVIPLQVEFFNTSSDVLWASFKKTKPSVAINFSEPRVPITNGIARTNMTYTEPGTFDAYATDGNVSCTTKVFITAVQDKTNPSVSLQVPKEGSVLGIPDTFELRAWARDDVVIRNIEFYKGSDLIANVTASAPGQTVTLNTSWNTTFERMGFYDISAISYDGAGNPSLIPSRARVILQTNRTCSISPSSTLIREKTALNFTVSCFNFTFTNLSQPTTNKTITNGTENFTISEQRMYGTVQSSISCPNMSWSSNLGLSDISPRSSPGTVVFTPQALSTSDQMPGTLIATDPVSGFSCESRFIVVRNIPGCSVRLQSPVLIGASPQIFVDYENLTRTQDFRISCRPNYVTFCTASPGSGTCSAVCDYPILGRYFVSASSSLVTCTSKKITVLQAPDTVSPAVAITKPFDRQILRGSFNAEAYATDNVGISVITVFIDSSKAYSCESSPCGFEVNSTSLRNGDHTIRAIAQDDSGNEREHSISITIAN